MSNLNELEMRCGCFCHIGKRPECDPICCYLCSCGSRIKYEFVNVHKETCPEHTRQSWMRKRRQARRGIRVV